MRAASIASSRDGPFAAGTRVVLAAGVSALTGAASVMSAANPKVAKPHKLNKVNAFM